jgi:serine O-acetyltransferase
MRPDLTGRISADITGLVTSVNSLLPQTPSSTKAIRRAAVSALSSALEDLVALTARDAAAQERPGYVYGSYLCFQALLAYRVAHAILGLRIGADTAARRICEEAKVRTGVDIHPAASIGRRLIIDHGWGTVIGEQVRIGDDCYILQNVTLGCRRIGVSSRPSERRHPTVGNRVIMAGGVCVLGPVTVGDDCRIDSGARITTDIPAGAHVRVTTRLQITHPASGRRPSAEVT